MSDLITFSRIRDPRDRRYLLTTPSVRKYRSDPEPEGGGYGRTFIFAVSEFYEIYIAPDSERSVANATKHETLCRNADVRAAGEIHILGGIIADLNDHSGSYDTIGELEDNTDFSTDVLKAFELNGYPSSEKLVSKLRVLTLPQQ